MSGDGAVKMLVLGGGVAGLATALAMGRAGHEFRFLAGAVPEPGDDDLATIGCRRPVFEAILRRAVKAEPTVDVRAGCRVTRSPSSNSFSSTILPALRSYTIR